MIMRKYTCLYHFQNATTLITCHTCPIADIKIYTYIYIYIYDKKKLNKIYFFKYSKMNILIVDL